jgi:N-acetylmuramoyl-L-alanine amidase
MSAHLKSGLVRWALLSLVGLAGCQHGPSINWGHLSRNQDSRVQFIVVHATEIDFPTSLQVLTHGDVSSHYLVDRDGTIYGLVPENRRAWHAGPSYWEGATPLNPSSIGIEIVSVPLGMPEATEAGFPEAQITAVERLVADIAQRHEVRPDRIVGHGEIQPEGRTDPGRLFPWQRLIAKGLVPTTDPRLVEQFTLDFQNHGLPDLNWVQSRLSLQGYQVPCTGDLDPPTRRVLSVFQGRYRQSLITGEPDVETLAILAALTSPGGRRVLDPQRGWREFQPDPPLHAHCASR